MSDRYEKRKIGFVRMMHEDGPDEDLNGGPDFARRTFGAPATGEAVAAHAREDDGVDQEMEDDIIVYGSDHVQPGINNFHLDVSPWHVIILLFIYLLVVYALITNLRPSYAS